ncbi:hypothetical protein VHEMI08822 [[Torrubiella] hemipterigena]|uniref:DUF788 domain-containing protein n=1 Tax=[Torrubiella] hemipterigena TaxID=1531966 RepID=A0A0A1TER0_9HYPO|nr:hypothetical protein VHEMI08822 [[Torrubiella] hemipterigena]
MAQKAKKDRAKANTATLNNLHIGSLAVNGIFLAFHFLIRSRSLWTYAIVSAPSFVCEYVLESSGRPSYDPATKALKTSGEDMAAQGLTEYMFDLIWITWASAILTMLIGNYGWFLMTIVPAYGLYLAAGLFGMGRKKMAQMQGLGGDAVEQPQGNRRQRRAAA